ncbi:RRP15-like protein [Cololabis saira]|uniref:RRP15-like protein n=1 Tax=Cololabis saira TaxID=129043 RepID=UPI002AD3692F|nr:RRP15-like protein [Cololabis saira]
MAVVETHVKQETGNDSVAHLDDEWDQTDSGGESDNAGEDSRDDGDDEGDDAGSDDAGSDDAGSDDAGSDDAGSDDAGSDGAGSDGAVDGGAGGGWAEAMAKILGKKSASGGSNILQKNKDLDKVKAAEREEQLKRKTQVDKKRTWEMISRVKPDVAKDRDTERALQRIATRGVVQLFNAVRKHQKTMDEKVKEAGGSERKKAKILSSISKKDFISALRRTEEGGRESVKTEKNVAAAAEEKPAWSVLRDDYMMEASMKDWDKDGSGGDDASPQ